jgi:hypothetical protein
MYTTKITLGNGAYGYLSLSNHRHRCAIESLNKKYNEDAIKQARKGCLCDAPNEMMHGAINDANESWKSVSAARFVIGFPAR